MNEHLQLGNPIEPAPIGFSFEAPGWHVLAVVLLLALLVAAFLTVRHYRKNKYRRDALKWLSEKEALLKEQNAYTELIYEAAILMKRIAIRNDERSKVAGLKTQDWVTYLKQTWKANTFDQEDELLMQDAIYSNQKKISVVQADAFVGKTKQWIKHHKHAF